MKFLASFILAICVTIGNVSSYSVTTPTNKVDSTRMLLTLAAPSFNNKYYNPPSDPALFLGIVEFQINYILSVIGNDDAKRDNIVIIIDKDTVDFYRNDIPDDVIIIAEINDIWMRDFTTVNPLNPFQFKYTAHSVGGDKDTSEWIQNSFNNLADKCKLDFKNELTYEMDGGNIVDTYNGKIITTKIFTDDNSLTKDKAKSELKRIYGANEVAIVLPDEDILAHADGMVMWVDDNTLFVNDYKYFAGTKKYKKFVQQTYHEDLKKELTNSFPGTKIVEVFTGTPPAETFPGFASSCGVYVNSVSTFKNIYMPFFGNNAEDNKFYDLIDKNTNKNIVPVPASQVCKMGGSVRCLTWQSTGYNAAQIIKGARCPITKDNNKACHCL